MPKVNIIGAGPSGIACAMQLARFGLDVDIFEKNKLGGLLNNANLVENYLGFPNGITGTDLIKLFQKQMEKYPNIKLIKENVIEIKQNKNFLIKTPKNHYFSDFLVIATGTIPKKTEFENNNDFKKYIYYEIKNFPKCKDKKIAIVGAGDAAFDYAVNLSKNNEIIILNRSNNIRAINLLAQKCKKTASISYKKNEPVKSIEKYKNGLLINNKFGVDFVIFAIGRLPEDTLINKDLADNPACYIIGDVKNGMCRQTSVAVGDGLKAAMEIYETIG
ncbi:MAG: NAD(P)/FAD-dependent oxidoreductase [Candidatus Gastranaerophilales bacterium]|nr:NAD(P)/FAD-dependent oxidoreductase [Candidatus Gastranaerophilales bacterium]